MAEKTKIDEIIVTSIKANSMKDAKGLIFPWKEQVQLSQDFDISLRQLEQIALENGITPSRYQRNRNTISTEQQLILFHSKVAVIGCGGLGGYIVEEIARLGIGNIVLCDPDVFEEHNLNRQLLSTIESLGLSKSEEARKRVNAINPTCIVESHQLAITEGNGPALLEDCDLIFDAVDSISTRLALADICATLCVPLVHGAIAGWFGQVTTELPGDGTLKKWYGKAKHKTGIEAALGNPSFTPATVASLQVAESCKVLLKQGEILSKKMLTINLLDMDMEIIEL